MSDEDMIDPIRDTATHQLITAGMPALEGHVESFMAGYAESQKPQWDNCRLFLIVRIDPLAPEDIPDHCPAGQFPPHEHNHDLVPITATGDMMAPIVPKLDGRVGVIRSADVGKAYVMGWAYGKWEMIDGQA